MDPMEGMEARAEEFSQAAPEERIVLKVKAKRSQGQMEALKLAQIARKANAKARKEEREEIETAPEPADKKDYKMMFKAQKAELYSMRLEQAVRDRVKDELFAAQARAHVQNQAQPPAVPVVSAPENPDVEWRRGMPFLRKKNHFS